MYVYFLRGNISLNEIFKYMDCDFNYNIDNSCLYFKMILFNNVFLYKIFY